MKHLAPAFEFQVAKYSGLKLDGVKKGRPQWKGTEAAFAWFNTTMAVFYLNQALKYDK